MSKKIEMRKCAVCGKKFTPKTANALYCSDKCYKAAKSKKDKARKAAKKASKKVVKAVCKQPVKLPAKPTKKVDIKVERVSPEHMVIVGLEIAISAIDQILKSVKK